ncbi:MaoC family dehydratase [Aliarcobacter cibarius]|uniref:MaoC family dehydratase n=1 Tax=Aliarcobacter cibarius TaxID=255507 RepID=A0ABY2V273_9BACT|nr:MaoC family dehydratase [Aliarcobacter cibarius]TLS95854.1 MaoC family dehydratase [Aliarcobacter cibarius]TLS96331.1 MaoC family dehydratase [Aliarcobacter cibarius]TLT03790.1 MaoC family dehydratase [Aliarcobacter cibarius]
MSKINYGNYFENFSIGQKIVHPLPRTVSEGDVSLYIAFTGSRFSLHSSDIVAREIGYKKRPIDDILMFHLTFGKSVQDISLNAIANLGYAEISFPNPVFVGDTVSMTSTVIGLKENSNGKSGVVYVHSIGVNQDGNEVLNFKRWVMVHKKDHSVKSEINIVPTFEASTPIVDKINIPTIGAIDTDASGGEYFFEDYVAGERLNHPEGITIDKSDHTLATKLYQNNAKVHFNDHMMKSTPMGQRLMYGGIVISMARAISFNGLQNAQWVYAINSGNHCNPTYAGDTIYAYTEILETIDHKREDIGLLRLRTIAVKNQNPTEISSPKGEDGKYLPNIVLDLDYTVVIPKKSTKK